MKKKIFTALGLMTGTSMDGVDLSLIKSDGQEEFQCIFNDYHVFDDELKEKLLNLREKLKIGKDLIKNKEDIKNLDREITLIHGQIIKNINRSNYEFDLIGFHGQTIFHSSKEKISKQLGDGKLLSQITRKIVINNFREKDLENGGQGAPLTPIFHELIAKKIHSNYKIDYPINILNIGGISNVTLIIKDTEDKKLKKFAYDIGPGNFLIDTWMKKKSKNNFDLGGKISETGKVNTLILNQTIDNFEIKSYEKSLDVSEFDLAFVKGLSLEDGGATVTKFTAYLIGKGIDDINKLNGSVPNKIFVCGGGRKNKYLLGCIKEYFSAKKIKIIDIDNFNCNGDFIESQAFGYLAIRSFLGLPISFPNTTRCKNSTTGGTLNKNY